MTTSNTITKTDLTNILNEVLPSGSGRRELLWTNTSTGIFNAQTIQLSLSSYDYVEVWFKGAESASDVMLQNPCSVLIGNRSDVVFLHGLIGNGTNENTGQRSVTATSTGVAFTDYKYKNRRSGGTTTTANQFCIPLYIYGCNF